MSGEELLPHIISSLNERDWELRASFFENISHVAICVGQTAVTEWILPCIDQALTDNESCVITNALNALAVLYELQLLDPKVMLDFLEKHVAVMVCHPVLPVRHTQPSRVWLSSCPGSRYDEQYLGLHKPSLVSCLDATIP